MQTFKINWQTAWKYHSKRLWNVQCNSCWKHRWVLSKPVLILNSEGKNMWDKKKKPTSLPYVPKQTQSKLSQVLSPNAAFTELDQNGSGLGIKNLFLTSKLFGVLSKTVHSNVCCDPYLFQWGRYAIQCMDKQKKWVPLMQQTAISLWPCTEICLVKVTCLWPMCS